MIVQILLASLGLAVGELIRLFVPEEVTPGEKYFRCAKHILYILLLISSAWFFRNDIRIAILLPILLISYSFKNHSTNWLYVMLGILLGSSTTSPNGFYLASILTFIIGIPCALLRRKKITSSLQPIAVCIAIALLVHHFTF